MLVSPGVAAPPAAPARISLDFAAPAQQSTPRLPRARRQACSLAHTATQTPWELQPHPWGQAACEQPAVEPAEHPRQGGDNKLPDGVPKDHHGVAKAVAPGMNRDKRGWSAAALSSPQMTG